MATEAMIHGQVAALGKPVTKSAGSAMTPQAKQIKVMARKGSSLILMRAFQPACSAAAVSTARKTRRLRCIKVRLVEKQHLDLAFCGNFCKASTASPLPLWERQRER